MRGVAILTSLFPPSVGGIQTQTLALARGLGELGTEVHVVTRPAAGRPAREEAGGVTVHRVGLARGGPAATLAYVALAARAVSSLGSRVSVVHAHQLLSPASAALLARALRGTPFVVTAHASGAVGDVASLARQGPLGRARLAALRRRAAAFVAVSEPIRAELARAGIPEDRIRSIPNGVDTRRFSPVEDAERRRLRRALGLPPVPVALYSGRLAPEKGVDLLVAAWAEARRRGVLGTLCLVGEGPERAALERRARGLGVAGAVRFAGAAQDLVPWLRAADAFVLPSRQEGTSVALLEAMACAVPVVATDVGGTRAAAGDTALLVPPDDPAAIAEALSFLLETPERGRTVGRAGRARAVERFGIVEIARRHLDLYGEAAGERLGTAAGRRDAPRGRGEGEGHGGWGEPDRVPRVVVSGDHGDVHPGRGA
jgi:glycosyltransferase involved in cell wall biosynthesis